MLINKSSTPDFSYLENMLCDRTSLRLAHKEAFINTADTQHRDYFLKRLFIFNIVR